MAILALGLTACATAQTPAGIAFHLGHRLRLQERDPLEWRCESVRAAERACLSIGAEPRCYMRDYLDVDLDDFTIKACWERTGASRDPRRLHPYRDRSVRLLARRTP